MSVPEPPAHVHATAALRRAAAERTGRVDLLLLHVGGEHFAVPLAACVEVIRLPDGADGAVEPELSHRGGRVPLLDGAAALGVPGGRAPGACVAAVLRGAGRPFALTVAAAIPAHAVDLAGVRAAPWPHDGTLLGVLPRGDTVVALVDVDALAALTGTGAEPSPLSPASIPPGPR